jgi:FtsZ-binding cell division protein ZapB
MDLATMSQLALLAAGIGGGWATGRRGVARQTVDLLQIQVSALKEEKTEKDAELSEIKGRVEVLESLVTQRAAVNEVREELGEVHVKVDRIVAKLDA